MTTLAPGRSVLVDPHVADLTENGRLLAVCAPLAEMSPFQIVNFIRGIEDEAASRALLAAAAALRKTPGTRGGGPTLHDYLVRLDEWALRPDRLVR